MAKCQLCETNSGFDAEQDEQRFHGVFKRLNEIITLSVDEGITLHKEMLNNMDEDCSAKGLKPSCMDYKFYFDWLVCVDVLHVLHAALDVKLSIAEICDSGELPF